MTGIHQRTAPTKINRTDWNDLVTFLGGTSDDPQVDATKILLAQGGSLLSTWRYASDLTKMDAAKVAGNIAAAQMLTNVLSAIIAAGGIVDADVAATAAIAKSKISTSGRWPLASHPSTPACFIYKAAAQSIPNITETALTFDSESWDTDTMHDPSTNPSRITTKTAGYYLVKGNVVFTAAAGGRRWAKIYANGSSYIGCPVVEGPSVADANSYPALNPSVVLSLSVNSYVELFVYQSSGGALNTYSDGTIKQWFLAIWIGQ